MKIPFLNTIRVIRTNSFFEIVGVLFLACLLLLLSSKEYILLSLGAIIALVLVSLLFFLKSKDMDKMADQVTEEITKDPRQGENDDSVD